ncbi:MAG: hypothetical protein MUE98_03020 [Rhodobacteraceae bacterium]|jgi:hypothetical protein|nr:hypothetical protein [Paracoccaceae bacterium]
MLTTTYWLFRARWSGVSLIGRGGSVRAAAAARTRRTVVPSGPAEPKPELARLRSQCAEDLRDLSTLPLGSGRRPFLLCDPVAEGRIPQDRPD